MGYASNLRAQTPADQIGITEQAFDDIATQTMDFSDILKLCAAELHNFSGLESTVEKQIGEALFAGMGDQIIDYVPEILLGSHVLGHQFYGIEVTWFGQRNLRAGIGAQCIQDRAI